MRPFVEEITNLEFLAALYARKILTKTPKEDRADRGGDYEEGKASVRRCTDKGEEQSGGGHERDSVVEYKHYRQPDEEEDQKDPRINGKHHPAKAGKPLAALEAQVKGKHMPENGKAAADEPHQAQMWKESLGKLDRKDRLEHIEQHDEYARRLAEMNADISCAEITGPAFSYIRLLDPRYDRGGVDASEQIADKA